MIYCVEDDGDIRELVVYTLRSTGFDAEGFADGAAFFTALGRRRPELVLLDIMLPGVGGLDILKRLRGARQTRDLPIIMLTAKTTEFDRVTGLDAGADDYICKPFGMMELVARVRALLRRAPEESPGEIRIEQGGLTLDPQRHTVMADGQRVELTLKEFDLLQLLMENPGIVLTRDRLLSALWGYDFDGETRTVDVHVRTLRAKLGAAAGSIETVRGVGYRFAAGN